MRVALCGFSLMLAAVAGGCGVTLTPAGQQVKIVTAAPSECKQLGKVQASSAGGHGEATLDAARIELRNQAGEMGGNVVHLEDEKEEGQVTKLSGTAFQCEASP